MLGVIVDTIPWEAGVAGVALLDGVFFNEIKTFAASRSCAERVGWGEGGIGVVVVTSDATDDGGLEGIFRWK